MFEESSFLSEGLWFIALLVKIVGIILGLILSAAYLSLAERRLIGFMQDWLGPNRVGWQGILQPIADALKLLSKEIIIPTASNRYLFIIAPILTLAPALSAWAVIPLNAQFVIAESSVGLLYVLAITSIGIYGIVLAGWASNSKYALLGALRVLAQVISYEIPMGLALLGVVLCSGSLQLREIVLAQTGGVGHWFFIPLMPLCFIYWIAGVAETNRAPFDVAEGESEIVAGFHVEYSGISFSIFFLAEYINMILISVLSVLLFFGGWLSPFEGIPLLDAYTNFIPSTLWLILKSSFFLFLFFWLRATFPRYRYDQIMSLAWKILIPSGFIWLLVTACWVRSGV